ncbi:MAG: helix-turn-helix transcriptional regulator [Deltaproteobacteria bacterium]|nr:helix-turn-helix transcriptional regulator [Deltaproteobacteria bacterium]
MPDAHLDLPKFYAALDAARKARALSWRQLASEAGVSASTLTRMAQGRRPDVDSFALLVRWVGLSADTFLSLESESDIPFSQDQTLAVISTYLRANKNLSSESASALEDIIQAAYQRLKKV